MGSGPSKLIGGEASGSSRSRTLASLRGSVKARQVPFDIWRPHTATATTTTRADQRGKKGLGGEHDTGRDKKGTWTGTGTGWGDGLFRLCFSIETRSPPEGV